MSMVPKPESNAISSAGVGVTVEPGLGCKLGIGTYFFAVSIPDASRMAIHCAWDANLVATSVGLEDSILPRFKMPADPDSGADASDISLLVGQWFQETAAGVLTISNVSSSGGTGGSTVTSGVIAIAGGTAGGAMLNAVLASRRARIKVVTTTGGYFRVCSWGKTA